MDLNSIKDVTDWKITEKLAPYREMLQYLINTQDLSDLSNKKSDFYKALAIDKSYGALGTLLYFYMYKTLWNVDKIGNSVRFF